MSDVNKPLLLAQLATAHASLLWAVMRLDEPALTTHKLEDWTCKDILAHVAYWEGFSAERLRTVLAGRAGEMVGVDDATQNPLVYAQRQDWPLCRVMADLARAHDSLILALDAASEEELERTHAAPWGPVQAVRYVTISVEHDEEHVKQIQVWREAAGLKKGMPGPACVLLPALEAGRAELLSWAGLIPEEQRAARPVCGVWTLQDVLGHVTDWERFVVDSLAQMAAGQVAGAGYIGDEETWNQSHAAARQGQSWEQVWEDFMAARKDLLAAVSTLDDGDLARKVPSVWDPEDTAYQFIRVCLTHDREHAEGLRNGLEKAGDGGTP